MQLKEKFTALHFFLLYLNCVMKGKLVRLNSQEFHS